MRNAPSIRRPDARSAAANSAGGAFTIIEMLVTIAIMSIIVAAIGALLVQCKRAVGVAHRAMRANHKIAVISESIRRDFRRVSRDGFLYLTTSGGNGAIVLTTDQESQSLLGAAKGMGSFVAYAMTSSSSSLAPQDVPPLPLNNIIWRPEYIFTDPDPDPDNASVALPDTDRALFSEHITLQDLRARSVDGFQALATGVLSAMPGNGVPMPPETMADVNELWPVLTDRITQFKVAWTDGSVIKTNNIVTDLKWTDAGTGYLWTARNTDNWPLAVKVNYSIQDPDWPEGYTEDHEIISEVP